MFEKPWNLAAYGLSLILLVLGILLRTNLTVIVALLLFVVWDVAYLWSQSAMLGRTVEVALQQTQNIREHISYFLAFYGVLFAIILTQSSERQSQFLEVCAGAGVPLYLLALPFLLASILLLFFPIQLTKNNSDEPSVSLTALVALSAFFQKVCIFVFVHSILRIVYFLSQLL